MNATKLSDDLVSRLRERALKLLEKPYAGSKAFRYNHSDARYISNCHGTMAYIFGLENPIVRKRTHPGVIPDNQMDELIKRHFLISNRLEAGDLICFYEHSEKSSETLLHTALLISKKGLIFQQSGTGGIFEQSTIEAKLNGLTGVESKEVKVNSYRLRD